MNQESWLFGIDLDGTLLKDSSTGEVHQKDIDAIKRLREAGHIVCIITGRPWRSTEKVYKALDLDTVVGNYNGAQIHNPTDYNFIPIISYMNLNDAMYILGDEKLQEATTNLAIEGPGWVMLEKRDAALERVFGFTSAAKFKLGINFHKLPLRPTGIILDTKKGISIPKLKDYLHRRYGDLVEFSSWSKGKGLTPVLDMTNVGVTKSKVISLLCRYYNIPVTHTVSIGDGYNDVPMFESTEISVAMKNASEDIQEITTCVTDEDHTNGGVASFVDKFLANEDNFIEKLREVRLQKFGKTEKTVKAH